MNVSFDLKIYNDEDKPNAKVQLTHEDITPIEEVKGMHHQDGAGMSGVITSRMISDRKLCLLIVNEEVFELSIDELKFAVERL